MPYLYTLLIRGLSLPTYVFSLLQTSVVWGSEHEGTAIAEMMSDLTIRNAVFDSQRFANKIRL